MMRSLRFLPFVALLLVPVATQAEPDHPEDRHQLVRIFEGHVRPGEQRIRATEAIGWLNYTSKIAQVSFDREVAKKLTCTEPGGFTLDGPHLISREIQATQFAPLCNLAPGAYDYVVTLRSGAGTNRGGEKKLEGRIVVE